MQYDLPIPFKMADQATWKKFKNAMKQKRTKGQKASDSEELKDEIVVQRLSSDVSGKAQKYSRVGPREFVKVNGNEELSVESIKTACIRHFRDQIAEHTVCDILAGDQGPSCSSMRQIPSTKLIYVRFIKPASSPSNSYQSYSVEDSPPKPKKCKPLSLSVPSPKKNVSHTVPRSLSVTHMLKIGKLVKDTSTLIHLSKFNIHDMVWSILLKPTSFNIEKEILGEGAFRKAYKADANDEEFSAFKWVVKEYKDCALEIISETNQTEEGHSKKVVQMHSLAKNITYQCALEVTKEGLKDKWGEDLQHVDIFLGKKGKKFVTVEQYIDGDFDKYINNDGQVCEGAKNKVILEKAKCLSHFSYEKSDHQLMIVDIQGCGYKLFDPEIASKTLVDPDKEILFTTGNLSTEAINKFLENHKCNLYCRMLNLPEV